MLPVLRILHFFVWRWGSQLHIMPPPHEIESPPSKLWLGSASKEIGRLAQGSAAVKAGTY